MRKIPILHNNINKKVKKIEKGIKMIFKIIQVEREKEREKERLICVVLTKFWIILLNQILLILEGKIKIICFYIHQRF